MVRIGSGGGQCDRLTTGCFTERLGELETVVVDLDDVVCRAIGEPSDGVPCAAGVHEAFALIEPVAVDLDRVAGNVACAEIEGLVCLRPRFGCHRDVAG